MGVKLPLQADANDTDILQATTRIAKDGSFKIELEDGHILQSGPIADPNTGTMVQWCDNVRAAIAVRNEMREEKRLREAREKVAVADVVPGGSAPPAPADSPEDYVRRGYEAAADRKERARLEFVAAQDAFDKWEKLHKALEEGVG